MVPRTAPPMLIPVQSLYQANNQEILKNKPYRNQENSLWHSRIYDRSTRSHDTLHKDVLDGPKPGHSEYYFSLYQDALRSIDSPPGLNNIPPQSSLPSMYITSTAPLHSSSLYSMHMVSTAALSTRTNAIIETAEHKPHVFPETFGTTARFNFPATSEHWTSRTLESRNNWCSRTEDNLSRFDGLHHSRNFLNRQPVFLSTEYLLHQKDKWRRPRTVYTDSQLEALEKSYKSNKYLRGKERKELCKKLQLEERHVKVWYQNRRAKERSQVRHDEWMLKSKKSKKDGHLDNDKINRKNMNLKVSESP